MTTGTPNKAHPWFRFYIEVMDDSKVQLLPPAVFKTWVNLLCLAATGNGGLPSVEDIAFRLRMPEKTARSQISMLVSQGLIDVKKDGEDTIMMPHNWTGRQYVSDLSTDRVRRFREKKKAAKLVAIGVDETKIETPMKRRETVS